MKYNKYRHGKIYCIVELSQNTDTYPHKIIYIGSTTLQLTTLYNYHIRSVLDKTEKYNWQMYKHMRQQGIGRFKIMILDFFPCNGEYELKTKEYEYINKYLPQFNFIKSYQEEKNIFTQR